jgi:hypothetical protein
MMPVGTGGLGELGGQPSTGGASGGSAPGFRVTTGLMRSSGLLTAGVRRATGLVGTYSGPGTGTGPFFQVLSLRNLIATGAGSLLTGSGLTSTNYTINYVPGNYIIVPADQLLVKMANVSATYGSDPAYSLSSARNFRSSNNTVYDLTSSVVLAGSSFSLNDGAGGNTAFTLGATTPALSTAGQLNVGAYQVGATQRR